MKEYTLVFDREDRRWVGTLRGTGVRVRGRSLRGTRRRAREALAAQIGKQAAARVRITDDVRLPPEVRRKITALGKALTLVEEARTQLRDAVREVTGLLTKGMNLSRRDAAELMGYSFQRIQQIAKSI